MPPYEKWQFVTRINWVIFWATLTIVVGGYLLLVFRWFTRKDKRRRK